MYEIEILEKSNWLTVVLEDFKYKESKLIEY